MAEIEVYLPKELTRQVMRYGNPPTCVALAITAWIEREYREAQLHPQIVRQLEDQLASLVNAQGACERILKTPLPFVYVVMIKQLIMVYLLSLPFAVANISGWWSPILMAIIALGLFGIEEASVETEDPFGKALNCLDMETFTMRIARTPARWRPPNRPSWRSAASREDDERPAQVCPPHGRSGRHAVFLLHRTAGVTSLGVRGAGWPRDNPCPPENSAFCLKDPGRRCLTPRGRRPASLFWGNCAICSDITNTATFGLPDLKSLSASVGPGPTLTSLALETGFVQGSEIPSQPRAFAVSSLNSGDASTSFELLDLSFSLTDGSVTITSVTTVVPEPSSFTLSVLGTLIVAGGWSRRRAERATHSSRSDVCASRSIAHRAGRDPDCAAHGPRACARAAAGRVSCALERSVPRSVHAGGDHGQAPDEPIPGHASARDAFARVWTSTRAGPCNTRDVACPGAGRKRGWPRLATRARRCRSSSSAAIVAAGQGRHE